MTVENFTSSDTWTVPAGVTSVVIECWGGGEGGDNGSMSGGIGGAGASYAKKTLAVTASDTHGITVGVAGAANLGNGGDSSFLEDETTAVCTASGGGKAGANDLGDTTSLGGSGRAGNPVMPDWPILQVKERPVDRGG